MDLYLVRLKKFEIYALANGMDEAYQKVRQKLDETYLPAQSSDGETILTSRIHNFDDCDVNES